LKKYISIDENIVKGISFSTQFVACRYLKKKNL